MPALGLGVFQTPPERDHARPSRAPWRPATATSTPPPPTATSARSARPSAAPASAARTSSSRPRSGSATTATTRPCTPSTRAPRKLGVDQIDLLILHQALPSAFDRTTGAYQALETLLADGKVRAIGVSNFMPEHLADLLKATSVVPAVNQIELHPYFTQPDVQQADAEHGILTQAWSPIGGITFYRGTGEGALCRTRPSSPSPTPTASPRPRSCCAGTSSSGRSVIPKSTKPERIAENFDVFDFELTADELARIDALDTGVRGGPEPGTSSPWKTSACRSPKHKHEAGDRTALALRYTVTHTRPNESGPPAREFAASGHPPTAPVPVTETAANR